MKENYLTYSPPKEDLLKEVRARAECKLYSQFSTCCDETYKRISDWCTGCILKAVADEMRSK
jgi:hypothetical protein